MEKTALIFGVTGQDGSYLSRLLLSKGYTVCGVCRRTSVDNRIRLPDDENFCTIDGDVADAGSVWHAIQTVQPDEIYNLAAQTHVHTSFAVPDYTGDVNALGPLRILEAMRTLDVARRMRFYQAGTSELFGQGGENLNEDSPMLPASPYGAAKLYAHHLVKIYRQAYGLFACNGILFNHESPVRGGDFVTAKIASYVAGGDFSAPLRLGNLEARRDWGFAGDYVDGMWRMLQQGAPDDYVLATGMARSVRDFVEAAFAHVGRNMTWSGTGADETGKDGQGNTVIRVDEMLYRPVDVPVLSGDAAKARVQLDWTPQTSFAAMVADMVDSCST